MNTASRRSALFALIAAVFLSGSVAAAGGERVVQVDCSSGKTIAGALERGNEALVVVIQGTCNETVVIERSDVTLRGEAGATVSGPDSSLDTLTVNADRVTIENLTVTGGRNGIFASGAGRLVVRGSTLQSTGRSGIVVFASSSALIDGCTIQNNLRDGVSTEGAQSTVVNSTITQNARIGVFVGPSASGRVGINNRNELAGNTISMNGANGVQVFGGSAIIAGNTITLNGTDPLQVGRTGITVAQATADIPGGNNILNNAGQGVFVTRGSAQIGNPSFGFTTLNTISGNGSPTLTGGVSGFLSASIVIRDAVISGNQGYGVILNMRSQAQIFTSQIQGNLAAGSNPGDGIRLVLGSSLLPSSASSVTGNAGAGLSCFGDSAAVNTFLLGSAGNGAPDSVCNPF